ncbi:MAG TPA: AAA family ATPase [Blastocatellia bacterium]|jgi:ABC-type cobalamin/Fe3+-siderophores transport system ATPase subunit
MIKTLCLKFGKGLGSPAEVILATPITVFVGPNNSGKSKVLAEIHRFCASGQRNSTDVIVDKIEFNTFTDDVAQEKIARVTLKPHAAESVLPNHIIVGKRGTRHQLDRQQLIETLKNTNAVTERFCQWYLQYNTLILDGKNRINLINQQGAGDLQEPPHTSFQVLFRDDTRRAEVRRIIHDAFSGYFAIDPTHLGHFRLRLSPNAPTSDIEERGIHDEAVRFHAAATLIEEASDGVKAFTGIITEIVAGDPAVLLIDEPEAFLHPSLAFKLGDEIARASLGSEKRLFVSTHSPNFVMGCIQSGAPVNIVRLTYRGGVPTARVLPNQDILRLMRNPLLRSTGVLSGLFYEFVVVTEADADRAFYQEINERLQRYRPELGIPNSLFINAQNKQTVQTIIRPLRELGIPAAGIVDIDILKEGGAVWTSFLESAFVPEIERNSLSTARAAVKQRFDQSGKDMKQEGGVQLLAVSDQEAANNLFERLAEYGLFVVRRGELESWLRNLGATGHTPGWLISIFEKMGEDPTAPNYVKPTDDDVWAFLGQVKRWLTNPQRKGIPT